MSQYQYNSTDLVRPVELTEQEEFLLKRSKTFCIYPWIHLHAYPTGEAYPCCHAEMRYPVGHCHQNTLAEIWQGDAMRKLRSDMLNQVPNPACARCYEQEAAGFFSGRRSANKHHGHHIKKLESNPFEITYWDIRFSNLCNLSCRSCGHIFSSSWYSDQAKLAGEQWASTNRALNIAGKTPEDMWNQLLPHIDYVEQIYFAGGEPLLMEEHYRILDELERRQRFDVRLIYNTNFTQVRLRDRWVFDYWKKFDSVAVGASLDAMGARAEYIRRGTVWSTVEDNRRRMLDTCPNVDFYISPTVSVLNVLHVPDFHQDWVHKGLLKHQDLNVNILQDPQHLRVDIVTDQYRQQVAERIQQHIAWLEPHDRLQRASQGFRAVIKFMQATDNTSMLPVFWQKTQQLDHIRGENLLQVIPELRALQS